MLFSFNQADGKKFGLGSTGLGGYLQASKQTTTDIMALKALKTEVKEAISNGYDQITDINPEVMSKFSKGTQDYLNTLITDGGDCQKVLDGINERINTLSTTGNKAKKILGRLGDTLINGLVSLGASIIISEVLSGIKAMINSYQDLAKAAQEYSGEYVSNKKQLSDYSSEIQNLRAVLSDQESTTEEVKDATARLYEIQNDLIDTYGSYATGIDLVNGKLSTQLGILEDIDKVNSQKAINQINKERSGLASGINTISNLILRATPGGAVAQINDFRIAIEELRKGNKNILDIGKEMFTGDFFGFDLGQNILGSNVKQITDIYEDFDATIKHVDEAKLKSIVDDLNGIEVSDGKLKISGTVEEVTESVSILQTRLREFGGQNDELIEQLQDVYNEANDIYKLNSENYETILMSRVYTNSELLGYYRQVQEAYQEVQNARDNGTVEEIESAQKAYAELINDIENSGIDQKYIRLFENLYPELQSLVSDWTLEVKIIPNMDDFTEEYIKSHTYDELMTLMRKDAAGIPISSNEKKVANQIKQDTTSAGFSEVGTYLSVLKGYREFTDNILHLKELLGDNYVEGIEDQFSDAELELIANIQPKISSKAKESVSQETQEQLEDAFRKLPHMAQMLLGKDFYIKDVELEVDPYSIEEIKEQVQDGINPIEVEIKTNVSDGINKLKALDDAFDDDLNTAYTNTKTEGGKASASEIEAVNSAFGGTTFDAKEGEDINLLSNAVEKYNQALVENAGDAEAAQDAHDKLATAYVDQNGVLNELTKDLNHVTDAEKEYYIEQLKEQGIVNAQEVVESRLTKQYKKHSDALKSLTKNITQNKTAFEKAVEAQDANSQVIKDMTTDVANLLAVYDEDGDVELTPEIDPSFIIQNAEDIENAIAGDIDAITKLRIAAAQKIYADVKLFDDAFWVDCQNVAMEIARLDGSSFDINGYMNNSDIIAKLNQINTECQRTGQNFANVLKYITGGAITAEYEWEEKEATSYNGMASEAYKHITNTTIKVLKGIKYKWNGSSTGVAANYGGSSGSSSNGSNGGSDSGSDSSNDEAEEDAKETFDWIEVYINRIEEDIARLDEVIDDVYDNWANRNEAVTNKISKLTDEIEAQTTAAKKYKEYAESLQVNDGENINADDYENGADDVQYIYDKAQYDAAVAVWATGTYQTKIQEGRKDEIEEIQNQYLKDIIDEYTEWWDKHIAADDAVKGLEISVKDQYKQLFKNVESEYEDLLTNIEKKSDIIDERITRIEEHGFFVDKSYYEQLRELALKNEEELTKELDDLVTKFNNAVENGHIEKGTEGWNEMYQSIQDTNKSLEEAHTKIVQIDNDIRQLQWDKFDWLEERMSDVAEEADFLIKVLQGEVNFDEQGNFNNRGFAQASLIGAKYDDAIARAKRYQEAIREIDEQMQTEGGKADKNLIERKESLVDAYRDAIEAAEDEKSAMQSLVKEGIQLQLDSLKELIDEYKNSLSAAKDLYTYQKNIADQTKNIANLEKQLRALENDNSEESRKRKLELQNQLDDAQQSLEETQWDRYISETGTMLDNMYSDYEEFLDNKTKEITALMNDMIEYINKNASNVEKGLSEIKTEYGFTTQHFEDFTSDQKALLNIFKDGNFSSKFSTITENISNILKTLERYTDANQNSSREIAEEKSVEIAVDGKTGKVTIVDTEFNANSVAKRAAEEAAKKNGNDNKDDKKTEPEFKSEISNLVEGNFGTWRSDDKGWWFEESDGSYPKNEYRRIDGEMYWFDDHGYAIADDGKWKWDEKGSWFENEDGWYPKDEWVWIDGVQYYFDEDGYVTNKRNYKGFAKGTRSVPSTDLYWTNEQGTEGIFKTDSGAILTPLNAGDMVFNHQQMEWLFDASKAAISGANKISPKIPGRSFGNFNATNNLTVVLPNVESYDDFKRQMKADRNVQQWMQEVTIGQMMGNNKLNSKKY